MVEFWVWRSFGVALSMTFTTLHAAVRAALAAAWSVVKVMLNATPKLRQTQNSTMLPLTAVPKPRRVAPSYAELRQVAQAEWLLRRRQSNYVAARSRAKRMFEPVAQTASISGGLFCSIAPIARHRCPVRPK